MSRLAALALAAALVLGLVGCDTSSALPGGSADLIPNPAASQTVPADGQDAAFQMHFIDVGQALSVLVECDGQFMLYDGGNVDDGSLVVSYLQSQGVEQLEYVFCSHAHEDHVGGLAAALAYFPAYHVYSPVTEASTKCFKDFVKYTQQQNLQVEVPTVGTQWALGSATVTMLGPVAQYEETNDTSIVLRIDYGATSFLLTGDMEADAERDLVASGANLKVDVLQVGHHGSSTSTSYVFLNAVLPKMGIISCGVNNKYGHPHEETLSILRDAGVDVYRTDLLGTITVSSDGQNYTVATEHYATDAELNPTDPAASSTAQQAYIGNFAGICLVVQKIIDEQDEKRRKAKLQLSYNGRMLLQAVWVVVAIAAPCFQAFASILPLFFPRITIYYLQITGKYKPLKTQQEHVDISVEDDPAPAAAPAADPADKGGET